MKNFLIHLLSGYTKGEYAFINKEYENQRERVSDYRARVEHLIESLNAANAERKELQDLIFKRFGVIQGEPTPEEKLEELQPIGTSKQRWSTLKTRMEIDDRKRVLAEERRGESNGLPS